MEIIQGSQQRPHLFINNIIQFLMLLLFFSSIMFVCLSASPPSFYYNLQGLDGKYMFLICNAILAVLTNTLKFDHSSFTHGSIAEVNQVTAAELAVHENLASMVELELEQDQLAEEEEDSGGFQKGSNSASMTEQEHVEEEEEEDHGGFQKGGGESEDDGDDEVEDMEEKEMASMDARVSTDELNKKFEEFIRKMKEEIRIEAQQQQPLVTV